MSRSGSSAATPLPKDSKIVVVGIGVAALTFIEEMHGLGLRDITVVAPDLRFGGQCVHSGCMPSEIFWAGRPLDETVRELSGLAEDKFRSWNCRLITDTLQKIEGKRLHLVSGNTLDFDVAVLATGTKPAIPPELPVAMEPSRFWQLERGRHLVIVNDGDPTAWSYADMAIQKGLSCTLVQIRKTLLDDFPSFRHFTRNIQARGVRVLSKARLAPGSAKDRLGLRREGQFHEVPFDDLLFTGPADLNLPPVDGIQPGLFDLDLQNSRMKKRRDVFILGDAAGFLSAAEAELKASQLAWRLTGQSSSVDLRALARLPLRFHAHQSWAAAGEVWSYLRTDWIELDFGILGWSTVHQEQGKLWYLPNPIENKVAAIHICHPRAGELIAVAVALLDLPLKDPRWLTSSVHPGAAEIFKYLAVDARRRFPDFFQNDEMESPLRLRLPALEVLDARPPRGLNAADVQRAFLEKDPWVFLALVMVARLEDDPNLPLYHEKSRSYVFEKNKDVFYVFDSALSSVKIRWKNRRYEITT